ncbi:MAG: two-component system, NtrC family, nitrogen regulation sensor histidine kinase NtrY [Desulfonauticus sp.]|nr:MAG: Multi-sensor signal transduction histidine kinase [Desulfonauticus sp. 38_4375]MDK2920512.1 two-component system, NtrC family, nitrogen regulation sensor histidine kinase NtrY [Desulfonauticus sp.]
MLKKIEVNPKDTKERKRRQRELFAAVGGVFLILGLTWVELKFFGVNSYLFLALFNLNLILLLVVLFLVIRNVFRLLIERRRKVLGSKLRTRLVLVFFSLSVIPTLLMFFIAVRLVQTSVDFWFQTQIETSLDKSLEVAQTFYSSSQKRLQKIAGLLVDQIREQEFLWGGKGMDRFLVLKQKEYGLSLVGVLTPQGREQNWHANASWDKFWPKIKAEVFERKKDLEPTYFTAIYPAEDGDLMVGIWPVDKGKTGYLVVGETLEQGLWLKLDYIAKGLEEYKNLKSLKQPIKAGLYTTLGIMTLVIIFGSTWFGFKLSREISAPVQALAIGTQRIARGDLDVFLEDSADDELGLLVRSFNSMARDLRKSQENLNEVNRRLAQKNLELASQNSYIQAVLNNITAGVISLNSRGEISTVNKAAENILDLSKEQVIGKRPWELLSADYRELFSEVWEQLNNFPSSQWQRQMDLEINNRVVKLLVSAVKLKEVGEMGGIVVVFEDISELEKMQRLAAWKEVARRIAHEIKNPLTPIKLSAQRLQKKFLTQIEDKAFYECTSLIIRQVDHLQELVKDFSSFAKLPEVNLRKDYLVPLLEEILEDFKNTYRDINWEFSCKTEIPPFRFDREALKRVFINIYLNAVEALSESKEKMISTEVFFEQALDKVFIEIKDTGPGMSVEERSRIFEPYFSKKKGGTGLGLAIVKTIINDHHGYIRVRENTPKGSIFVLELPV